MTVVKSGVRNVTFQPNATGYYAVKSSDFLGWKFINALTEPTQFRVSVPTAGSSSPDKVFWGIAAFDMRVALFRKKLAKTTSSCSNIKYSGIFAEAKATHASLGDSSWTASTILKGSVQLMRLIISS